MRRVVYKKAFSLIELVISIVIIGIVAASFPMIMSQTNNNLAFAMRQEAVLATKTYIGTILSYDWDPIAKYSDGGNSLSNIVVSTGESDFEDTANATKTLRWGHVDATSRRKMYFSNTIGALVGANSSASADVPNTPLNLTVAPSDWDYIAELKLTPNYAFMDTDYGYDVTNLTINATIKNFFSNTLGVAAAGRPSDIKRIRVTTTNNSQMLTRSGINIVLSVFTSNIGKMEFDSRSGGTW